MRNFLNINSWIYQLRQQVNYDYDGRYYIAGSFRRDGSSRLSPDNRWGNFDSYPVCGI